MKITLTDAERLILSNQYEIMATMNRPDNVGLAEHYESLADSLRRGHAWLYQEIFNPIEPVMREEENDWMLSVLGMFAALQSSYEQLDDRSGIDASSVRWQGFDGNNESELLSYTRALAQRGLMPDVLKGTPVNSHAPMKDVYGRMLLAYHGLGSPHLLSREELQLVIAARRYPGN